MNNKKIIETTAEETKTTEYNNDIKANKDNKKILRNVFFLQCVIFIYTLSTIMAKFAAGEDFFSFKFILFYGIEILILGIYAILWQQVIKKFEISIAYANKAMALFWSIIWAILLFNETVTIKNVIGVVIVIIGTIVVNKDEK